MTVEMGIAQAKVPLFLQCDLWHLRETAARVLIARRVADRVGRRLCRAELQVLALCDAISEIVVEDPTGDLALRAQPRLPTEHQLRMGEDAA